MSRKNNQDEEREARIKELMDRARKHHERSKNEKKNEKKDEKSDRKSNKKKSPKRTSARKK